MSKSLCFVFLLCAATSAMLGCGNGLATVQGVITFNGEPVNRGMINLEPTDGKGPVTGSAVESGKFSIADVSPGEKIVRISAVYVKKLQKESDGSEIEICDDLLPASYGQTSSYRIDVKAPITKQDYSIEGPDPRKGIKK